MERSLKKAVKSAEIYQRENHAFGRRLVVKALDLNADVPGTNPTFACSASVQEAQLLSRFKL